MAEEDPFVTNNMSIINPLPVAQTYTITVTLPIAAFPYDATIASSSDQRGLQHRHRLHEHGPGQQRPTPAARGTRRRDLDGIRLRFTLSAFDQVAITSRFEIANVPEPTAAALLGRTA